MIWLEDAVWRREDLAVVGTLAWYDYSAADPDLSSYPPEYFARHKGKYNNDANFIGWPWSDPAFAARLGDAFIARLMRQEADPAVRAIVVVTHVPLFEPQVPRKPGDLRWGMSNAYFGNLALGRRVLAARKVCAVVSGHTHAGRSALLPRPQVPDAPAIALSVVPSDYGAPAYLTLESSTLAAQ
jgi:hypothetical protein